MKITVDPNTDASGFDYVEAGEYKLRVVSATHKEAKDADSFPGIKWEYELADPNILGIKDKKPGHIFEFTTLKTGNNSQFKLRQVSDALGLAWGELETDTVVGVEFDAQLKVDEYQGTMNNKVAKYISAV